MGEAFSQKCCQSLPSLLPISFKGRVLTTVVESNGQHWQLATLATGKVCTFEPQIKFEMFYGKELTMRAMSNTLRIREMSTLLAKSSCIAHSQQLLYTRVEIKTELF